MSNETSHVCGGIHAADKPFKIQVVIDNRYCPVCGISNPWRKVATKAVNRIINGVYVSKRQYSKCRRCGVHATLIYRDKEPLGHI